MTEEQLIYKCKELDRKAQKELFEKYAPYLLSIAQRYIKDFHLAEDVFLKSFEKIFRNLNSYKSEKNEFRFWCKKIVINEALNYLRKNSNLSFQADLSLFDHYADEPEILSQITTEELHKIISSIREPYGIIFNMVLDGYSYPEISEILAIKEATCRSYYMRSKVMLREILTNNEILPYGNQ